MKVLVGATLPARKGPGKLARALQHFINQRMSTEFFTSVVSQRLDLGLEGRQPLNYPLTCQFRRLV